ncbi:ribosomal protein L4 [Candidatus Hydrogenisulfobacillus filiaventi]|uniref:Large ribosomal subunit protein uL4 n=1 Tax=Candidatus Hydrogenisulfobacillus filiaventi TaxID=2707344 RepID=A0A6F8ZIY3_9FIRM|nr:50S ribosomal protein L4 [Bacillota bacterium]CAB1129947.1 ribosomal protein L4 [Candidatus Hydrogenisulfobacillus filiaventi]
MPTVKVYDLNGEVTGELELSDRVFGAEVNPALLHQAVVTFEANQRAGTASTKTRGEVRGGGRKPWRQKGTGRARQGSIRAPHWRHGGVVFGPKPRDYSLRFPRKMRQAAIRQALSAKLRDQELVVVQAFDLPEAKTRVVKGMLERLGLGTNALLVTAEANEALKRSARNFQKVATTTTQSLNAYILLRHARVVMDRAAVAAVEEALGR